VDRWLEIDNNLALTDISGLGALESVEDWLIINNNAALTGMSDLTSLTKVGEEFWVYENGMLPDCDVCSVLDQLTSVHYSWIDVHDNLDDTCTPVPGSCP
jgi:hypothetical protein